MTEPIPDELDEDSAGLIDNVVPTRGYEMTPLVGLGGSAGSIQALQSFFSSMPANSGLAFVVVLHLAPNHESILDDILQRTTRMRVLQVRATTKVEPNTVYVIPPGKSIRSANGHLRLAELRSQPGRRVAVDNFFRTLADSHGPHSAAIVLSGGDGDGAVGIKRIRERGGLTIAQDPAEAEHPSMPEAAVATGMVDWVLPVQSMASRLLDYYQIEKRLRLPPEQGVHPGAEPTGEPDEALLREVHDLVRARTGRDFSYYKRATVLRRIARRMQVNGVDGLPGYLDCLRTRPGEAGALLQDLLISVTNFFRDADSFDALAPHIAELFVGKGPSDTLRVWVTACATGEEAYSLAMMFAEHARTLDGAPTIQLFASDLDENAVQTARAGLYPSAIEADVSPERLSRFFVKEHDGYRVRREMREMVLFATHDLLKDSPFSRLDLATCRNLLIYLDANAQARVFEVLHFALLPHGKLFLGSAESVEEGSPLFTVLDKKHRIFVQSPAPRLVPVLRGPSTPALTLGRGRIARETQVVAGAFKPAPDANRTDRGLGERLSWGEMHLKLLEHLAPPSVLVDAQYDVVHLSASAGRLLQHGAGEPSRNLLRLVPAVLRPGLRTALHQALQKQSPVETAALTVPIDKDPRLIRMRVVPVTDGGHDMSLVVFEGLDGESLRIVPQPASMQAHDSQLDQELERVRMHLRETVDQYENSTQELKASNEELQASNEELRSATEELETSREELQSINEELSTINHELKGKVDELAHANSDMKNLMDATAIATVFLDSDLRITRYTPSAVRLFNLIPGDVGRPLSDLAPQLEYEDLDPDARRVLERLVPIEHEVGRSDGTWFLARLLPYRTAEDRIAGVVLSFIDITQRRRAEEVSRWLSAVVASSVDAIVSFSVDGTILSWNGGAERLFGHSSVAAIGQPFDRITGGDGAGEQGAILGQIREGRSIAGMQMRCRSKDGIEIHVSLTASPIIDAQGAIAGATATARDVGEAVRAQEALRRSEERMRMVVENAREYAIFSTDGERVITSWNSGAARLLGYTESEAIGQLADIIFTDEDRRAGAPLQEAQTALRYQKAADERFHVRKNGDRFWGSGTLMRMEDREGGAVGFVKILRDQSAAREAQAALQRSRAELLEALKETEASRARLEEADAAKDRFLAVLSHELRNPLASISSAATMLTGGDASEPQRVQAAHVVERQARTMKVLIDDLLDVSRLAVGRLELHRQDLVLSSVIQAALETAGPLIESSRHRLTVRLPDAPVYVRVDPLRIGQVVVNLLTNAAKYTPPGGEVLLQVEPAGETVVIVVADNGVGMAPAIVERMFDLYTQGPATPYRTNEGLGVGLALVRNIVKLHGGQVDAESEGEGKGSRFRVVLPTVSAASQPAAEPSPPPTAPPAAPVTGRTRVLIADDNPDAGWTLSTLLGAVGFETVLAASGPEALEAFERSAPDVVILDIGMPGMSGIEVAQRLRARPAGADVAVIALSGWGAERAGFNLLDQGFDMHLTKPVEMPDLIAAMNEVVAKRVERRQH